ncbi:short-subunit dehydrogenase [Hoyosella altamirensis]|uniref:Short-subunit dehydrogenase n=2 Tax=Hoyosella altamirensis TaxID=616997 RepID=A0A839RL36_9ACTN|nr:short-subunit dehydrogenase [Hoyosella altamirensis]
MRERRYCVIGAGYAGLGIAKAFIDAGLDYDHFEATDHVGGNWAHGVYDSTTMISSKQASAYSDYPMPDDYPMFCSAAQMRAYLQDYADHFGVTPRISFNTEVTETTPIDATGMAGWTVRLDSGEVRRYAAVVVANGHYWALNIPTYPGQFTGKQIHSKRYRNPSDVEGRRVLVVGAGNSGCDLAVESANAFGSADLSMRTGYWFIPKTMWGVPVSSLDQIWAPRFVQKAAFKAALMVTVGAYERYGLPKPGHDLFDKDVTVNSTMPYAVLHGKVKTRPEIKRFDGRTVHFVDGSSGEYDTILWATGFRTAFPFLAPDLLEWHNGQPLLYQHVVPPRLANLYFFGNVAPRAGAGKLITEGARLITKIALIQGEVPVPLSNLLAKIRKPQSTMLAGQSELLLDIAVLRRLINTYTAIDRAALGLPSQTIPVLPRNPLTEKRMSLPKPNPARPAVVTGASSGIGTALAENLAARGYSLILVARRKQRLDELAVRLRTGHGVNIEVIACDLSDAESRAKLATDLGGREIAILCNNAGSATYGRLVDMDPDAERDQVSLNVNAVHDLTLAVLPGMIARRSGAILITGSTAGNQPSPNNATYSASKAFANTFAESLHGELAGIGVTCSLLAPGPVRTEFAEAAGIPSLESLLPGYLWVSAEDAAKTAIAGLADGRRRIVPGLFAKAQTAGAALTPSRLSNPVLRAVYGRL